MNRPRLRVWHNSLSQRSSRLQRSYGAIDMPGGLLTGFLVRTRSPAAFRKALHPPNTHRISPIQRSPLSRILSELERMRAIIISMIESETL
jgi:hypothetical protein